MKRTTQGAMTGADIEEWRRDTDWYELYGRPDEDEE